MTLVNLRKGVLFSDYEFLYLLVKLVLEYILLLFDPVYCSFVVILCFYLLICYC